MNEELNEFVLEFLKDGKEIVLEQAPLYVQELVMWHRATALFWVIFGCIITILWFTVIFKLCKSYQKFEFVEGRYNFENKFSQWCGLDNGNIFNLMFFACVLVLGTLFGPINTICETQNLIKSYVAPRVIIVEHLTSKGN